jgi:hypothetical protein
LDAKPNHHFTRLKLVLNPSPKPHIPPSQTPLPPLNSPTPPASKTQ